MFSRRFLALLALGAALPAALMPAAAQNAPAAPPAAVTPAPPVAPPLAADWSRKDAEALLAYVQRADEEGLDPANYNPGALRDAIETKGDLLDGIATATFLKLAG
ncbi:MAG: hypothetical protein ABWX67_01020, partial [Allosphingosinicella sp.]